MNHERTDPFAITAHQGLYSREGQLVFGTCQVVVPGMWRSQGEGEGKGLPGLDRSP